MSEHASNPEAAALPGSTPSRPRSVGEYVSSLRMYPRQAWGAMIACAVTMMLSPPGVFSAATTFFVGPVAAEFGWTQSQTLTLFSLPFLLVPFVLPFGGRWVDRRGAKVIAVPAIVLYALTTALTALVGSSQLALGAILVISMAFGYIGSVVVVFKVVLEWFPHHRGVAFATVGALASLSSTVFAPLSEQLISAVGWRVTFVLLGLAVLVLVVPAQVFLLSEPDSVRQARDVPAPTDRPDPAPAPVELPGVTLRKAVRTRAWLLLALILALAGAAITSVSLNAVALLGEHGYSPETVSLSLSVQFASSIIGLMFAGVMLDWARSPRVIAPLIGCVLVALLIVASLQGAKPLLFLAMCLLGVVRGAESTIGPYLISRYFGQRAFGQLQGLTLGVGILVMSVVPIVVQAAREQTSSYNGPLLGLIIASAIAFVLVYFMPRYPARDTEPGPPSPRAAQPADSGSAAEVAR